MNRNKDKWLTSNLLVLTTLTAKLKRFLNATFTTEYNSIYGNVNSEFVSSLGMKDDSNDEKIEMTIIEMLLKRLNDVRILNDTTTKSDYNILVHFNETELNLIGSIFEKFFNISCSKSSSQHTSDMINKNNTQNNKMENNMRADVVSEQDKHDKNVSIPTCALNNTNSLSNCQQYLQEKRIDFPNNSRTIDITKVFCKQLQFRFIQLQQQQQQQHQAETNFLQNHKSNNVPNTFESQMNDYIESWTETIQENRNDGNSSVSSSNDNNNYDDDFMQMLSNQIDDKFNSEYFQFFDFIVTKLMHTHNLTVNYNNFSGNSNIGAINSFNNSSTTSVGGDTSDFCVLDFRLNIDSNTNRTQITTTFAWRPVLILRQSELYQNVFVTHPLLTIGYHRWFFDNTQKFWMCGLLCWILAGIVILLLVCILVASITFGLAIR